LEGMQRGGDDRKKRVGGRGGSPAKAAVWTCGQNGTVLKGGEVNLGKDWKKGPGEKRVEKISAGGPEWLQTL